MFIYRFVELLSVQKYTDIFTPRLGLIMEYRQHRVLGTPLMGNSSLDERAYVG